MLPQRWNELCADLRNAPELPEVWNQNEAIGEKIAVFRNRKADMWYTRIDEQYFPSVKSMAKKFYQNMIKDYRAAYTYKQALNQLKFEQGQFSEAELHVVELLSFQTHVLEDLSSRGCINHQQGPRIYGKCEKM